MNLNADPTENICQESQLFNFFKNDSYRKQYNQLITLCRKYHQFDSHALFLEKLIENKLIPNYFRIKNKNNDTLSDQAVNTSLTWMKDRLDENKRIAKTHLVSLVNAYNNLIACIPPNIHQAFREKFTKRGMGFKLL